MLCTCATHVIVLPDSVSYITERTRVSSSAGQTQRGANHGFVSRPTKKVSAVKVSKHIPRPAVGSAGRAGFGPMMPPRITRAE
eukprot:10192751-Lingulodinium_polyedra.AAC.1